MKRVLVVGPSGSGKSTFARRLTEILQLPYVELDGLYWKPNWQESTPAEFVERVDEATAGERWVVDGNYGARQSEVSWPRATHIIWLNYSFPMVFSRAVRRTVRRVFSSEMACGGNRETFRRGFLSWDGIPCWVLRSFRDVRKGYQRKRASGEHGHLQWIELRRPRAAERLLSEMASRVQSQAGSP